MKVKRQKKVHRFLAFFKHNFGFRTPFQVLIDGTFCHAALKYKVNIQEQMPKYLDNEIRLFTTPCVVTEIEKLGPLLYGAMLIVKQYPVRRCGHEMSPISGSKCFYDMFKNGNQDHYIIATQDRQLTEKVRKTPGVPLLYMNFNAIIMDKPSEASENFAKQIDSQKTNLTDYQTNILKDLKKEILGEEEIVVVKKRKKIKGPNPLSCKKRKKKKVTKNEGTTQIVTQKETSTRKRRNRIKIAKHVKEAWKEQKS